MTITDQERAERSTAAIWEGDAASKALGIVLDKVTPGKATAHFRVEDRHLNGHGICHGGYIFTLADTAFAFACNSYNKCVVAQQNSITYLATGKMGDTLIATATEVSRKGRFGVYDVCVRIETGEDIAVFRGNSRQISGVNFREDHPEIKQ